MTTAVRYAVLKENRWRVICIAKTDAECFDDVLVLKLIYAFVLEKESSCILHANDNLLFFFIIFFIFVVIVIDFFCNFYIVDFQCQFLFTYNFEDFWCGSSSEWLDTLQFVKRFCVNDL